MKLDFTAKKNEKGNLVVERMIFNHSTKFEFEKDDFLYAEELLEPLASEKLPGIQDVPELKEEEYFEEIFEEYYDEDSCQINGKKWAENAFKKELEEKLEAEIFDNAEEISNTLIAADVFPSALDGGVVGIEEWEHLKNAYYLRLHVYLRDRFEDFWDGYDECWDTLVEKDEYHYTQYKEPEVQIGRRYIDVVMIEHIECDDDDNYETVSSELFVSYNCIGKEAFLEEAENFWEDYSNDN